MADKKRTDTDWTAAGAAYCAVALSVTEMAAAEGLYVHFHSRPSVGSILKRGVARRSFGLLRCDLLLQIDPSALGPRACYILRR
jgi:hypothetical protein